MENTLFGIAAILTLTILHELGHIVAAKALNLKILKVGGLLKPVPHFFVSVSYPEVFWKKFIFLMGGVLMTYSLLLICIFTGQLYMFKWLPIAFAYQVIVETNPFHSDFTLLTEIPIDDYLYSTKWYFHFLTWMLIIIITIKIF